MRFIIPDENVYRVIFADGGMELDGDQVWATFDPHDMAITIDRTLPASQLLASLLHELCHAYMYHVPRPRFPCHAMTEDAEPFCEWYATVTASIVRQLEAQGGLAGLYAAARVRPPAPAAPMPLRFTGSTD